MDFNNPHFCPKIRRKICFPIAIFVVLLLMMNPAKADDYFWIGGTGYWSDINHWATNSGGTVIHIQAPTAEDNVFFDVNSFSLEGETVTINQKNAVCHDMNWLGATHSPVLYGNDTTSLRLYGSIHLIASMTLAYEGIIYFESTNTGQTIKCEGKTFIGDLIFQGSGGSWALEDDFRAASTVRFLRGGFITNGHALICSSFISDTQEPRNILLANSSIQVFTWQVNGTNLVLDAQLSNFVVGGVLSSQQGTRLIYNNVDFVNQGGNLSSTDVYSVFDRVTFVSGSVLGECSIDTLLFDEDGMISGSDSINYAKIGGFGQVMGGSHVVKYIDCSTSCIVDGANRIDSLFIKGDASIGGNNIMDTVFVGNTAQIVGNNAINKIIVTRDGYIKGTNNMTWAFLNGNTYFGGANSFDTLNLTAGRTYTFACGSTQTINKELNAAGTCYEPIRMLSDTNGVEAVIFKQNGPFISEYLSLRDMKAEGSLPFVAAHSVDLGNNTNWSIQTSIPKNLYWVNDQGLWSDPYHWDILSGGPGGECPPTEIDNAYFDQNSFSTTNQTVIVDVNNAVCDDMNWENVTNSPKLSGTDTNNLRIYGSLYFESSINNSLNGEVFFEATDSGQIVRSATKSFKNNIWFNGRGGFWALEDYLTVNQDIYFQQGGIQTRGNTITCKAFSSIDTTTRYLNLSTSTVKLLDKLRNVWIVCGLNLTLHADSSLLQSMDDVADITSFSSPLPLIYNNVEFYGNSSWLVHEGAYCNYNLATFFGDQGEVRGDCTIDTATFHGFAGAVYDSDTIKTAIFYKEAALVKGGNHVIEIAYFYNNATVEGNNTIDTALFYRDATILDTNIVDTAIVYNRTLMYGKNTFRTATLLGDGNIYGNHTFSDLTLTKNRTYYFENSKTQTIIDNFNLQGACTGPIILQSDENTMQATLHKVNGGVEGEYLSLRDIKATGNQLPFLASNSVDLGNNFGWDISTSNAMELYWVNGTGDWSDSLHWAGNSGGLGGYCIPTPIDNVYFDQNSFLNSNDTVLVDMGNATCHNMNWTGAKAGSRIFGPDTNNLRIYGSLKLNPYIAFKFEGPVYFETTEPDHTIETFGVYLNSPAVFQGIGGEWTLLDKFNSHDGVILKHGSLDLNQDTLNCKYFDANYETIRQLDISGAQVFLSAINFNAWDINTKYLNFYGSASGITSQANNGLVRTEGGGKLDYNDVFFTADISRIYNVNTEVRYNNIIFESSGEVHGNCAIDTLIFGGSGSIFDSDSINFAHVRGGLGILSGGRHIVNTILFEHDASITGNNSIDTTIIHGAGNIAGTNSINKSLIVGKKATISGQNNFGNAILMGNGTISDPNIFKTLKLTAGNLYEFEQGISQSISENFYVRGNNCFPITIRSQHEGQQAIISVPSGVVVSGDYLELRDINAGGGATFYAGNFSTDISNNDGWLFANAPGYIYGFAPDTTVCSSDVSVIGTQNFNPDAGSTFLWHDGSTAKEYLVQPDDTIAWVTVSYADDCAYTDSIEIHHLPSPFVEMGDDIALCQRDTLYPLQLSESISYEWFDGSINPYILTDLSGNYGLTVTNEFGCTAYDELFVDVLPSPIVDLGQDTTLHIDEQITLDAENPGANYFWSTGDTSRTIIVGSNQTYWVSVAKDGCMAFDTISIGEFPPCVLAVPTAFSPNGDGINDVLYVRGDNFIEFELMIFNRWGELVFKTGDNSIGWNGTFQGQPQAVDAYNFYLKGRCVDNRITSSKGTITLLR